MVMPMGFGAPMPQIPPGPQMQMGQDGQDPVAALIDQYNRLDAQANKPAPPMFTPDQQNQRINQNNQLAALGVLGQASGDKALSPVGGSVLKQALSQREPMMDKMGMLDPLTGERAYDPGFIQQRQIDERQHVLDRAVQFENARQTAAERAAIVGSQNQTRADIAELRAAVQQEHQSQGHNMQIVTDPQTGQSYWADPRSGTVTAPVVTPSGSPIVHPDKLAGPDEKSLSDIAMERNAIMGGLAAVQAAPDAFGKMKGLPNQLGDGPLASTIQSLRDASMPKDQLEARAMVFNNVSRIIKERAGTAQSVQELARLRGFLPSDMDTAASIAAKFHGYLQYLDGQEQAIRSRYTRPTMHLPGSPGAGAGAPPTPGAPAQPAGSGYTVLGRE